MADGVLYVLVRTDLDSMTSGRIAAQVSHATSMFHRQFLDETDQWISEGYYGPVVVIDGVNEDLILALLKDIDKLDYVVPAGIVVDKTYPVQDGDYTHYVEVATCAYILIDREKMIEFDFVRNMQLL